MTDDNGGAAVEPAARAAPQAGAWLAAINTALVALGVMLGVWGAFLVPLRLPGGVEGLAVVIGVVGNFVAGVAGAYGTGRPASAAMPGLGWMLAVLVLGGLPLRPGDVVIPGRLPVDPGVATVGLLFFLGGAAAMVAAVAVATRSSRRR